MSLAHRMFHRPLLACTLVAAMASPAFAAPEPTGDADSDDAGPDWAIGASVTFGSVYFLGGLGGLAAVGAQEPGLIFERRLDDRWWLLFGVSGSLSDAGDLGSAQGIAGRVGARYVIDPSARVRVAPTLALVAGAASAEQTSTALDQRSESRTVRAGMELGLDVELALTDGLALRLQASLLSLTWTSSRSQTNDDVAESDGVTATVGLRPSLALVLAF